jgi:hypothetical protein
VVVVVVIVVSSNRRGWSPRRGRFTRIIDKLQKTRATAGFSSTACKLPTQANFIFASIYNFCAVLPGTQLSQISPSVFVR